MSPPRFATPLRLTIEHSLRLQILVVALCSVSLLSLYLTGLPVLMVTLGVLVIIWSFLHVWRGRPELGGEPAELILRPNGNWLLERGGESVPLRLHGQTTISRPLLLLCFREQQGRRRYHYLLWQAEHSPALIRRLRVYLKLYASDAL